MEHSVLRCADVLGLPYGLCSMERMELGGLERSLWVFNPSEGLGHKILGDATLGLGCWVWGCGLS